MYEKRKPSLENFKNYATTKTYYIEKDGMA